MVFGSDAKMKPAKYPMADFGIPACRRLGWFQEIFYFQNTNIQNLVSNLRFVNLNSFK